jgi:hypothetical protein
MTAVTIQGSRLLASNPDTKVAVGNRSAAVRDNTAEGKAFYDNAVRRTFIARHHATNEFPKDEKH